MKQAILCVSFGTSVAAARGSITAVEEALRALAPERAFRRAFTSPTIRRMLEKRGECIPSVGDALALLAEESVGELLIQPTHLLYGIEYDKIKAEADAWAGRFSRLCLGRPLLAGSQDIRALASALSAVYPAKAGERLVLLGHGTEHAANAAYPAMQTAFHLAGWEDVLVGTVEGWPGYEDVSAQLARSGDKAVHLAPLMLVAGDHACNDMAGEEEESWKSRLEAEGYQVRCTMQGLGMLPAVVELYCRHAAEDL